MSKQLTKMDIYQIKQMKEAGMSVEDIAYVMERGKSTIYDILNDKYGERQEKIADRMEYFLGGATKDDGCYVTSWYEDENGELVITQQNSGEINDPTSEEADWERFLEKF